MNDYPPKPADYYMNLNAILSVCDGLISSVDTMDNSEKNTNSVGDVCGPEALHVDNKTLQEPIWEIASQIGSSKDNAISAIDGVKANACALYNALEERYNQYMREQAEKNRSQD